MKSKPQQPKRPKIKARASDSDDDIPLAAKSKSKSKSASSTTKISSASPSLPKKSVIKKDESDDDVPLARVKTSTSSKAVKRAKPESDSDDDVPLAAKTKKPKVKSPTNGVPKRASTKKNRVKEEVDLDVKPEDEDEEYRWWEAAQHDGTKKWTTLEHNGVLFPPPYEPLPKHVKMKYEGKEVTLPPEAEEVAGFFAALIESDHGKNPVFQQNFFNDWLEVLKEHNAVYHELFRPGLRF